MPTIVKPPDPEKIKPMALRVLFRCWNCGCHFRLNEGDKWKEKDNSANSNVDPREPDVIYEFPCPACGDIVNSSPYSY